MKESRELIKEALEDSTRASDGDDPRSVERDAAPTPDHPVPSRVVDILELGDASDIIIKVHIIPYFDVLRLTE
jgi:hypothetical protein